MSTSGPFGEDPEIVRMQRDALRRMTPEQKMRLVRDLNRAADAMAEAGIRDRYPAASDREVFLRLAVRKLGYRLASAVYPEVETLEGIHR